METALRSSKKIALFGLAATLLTAGTSQAAITIYTSQAAFNAATTAQGIDTYAGFSVTGSTPSPINRNAGAYTYTANPAPAGTFYGAGTAGNPWLSTNIATDVITFNNFSGGAQAVGGNFFGSNIAGGFQAGDVTLVANDGAPVSHTIVGATTSSFVGFVSDGTMSSLTLAAVQPTVDFLWPTADNFTLAMRANIPEPTTLGALAAAGAMVLRRRR